MAKSKGKLGKLATLTKIREGYAKSFDGTKIFYRVAGNRGTPLICCNGLGVSTFFWIYFEKFFKEHHTVITWDYRGHGRSKLKKNAKNYTVEALTRDCKAVCDAVGVKKGIFFGHSIGTQVIFEFYKHYPKKVKALIPCFGTYARLMDTFYDTPFSKLVYHIICFLGFNLPELGNLISTALLKNPFSYYIGGIVKTQNTSMVEKRFIDEYLDHLLSIDPSFFTHLLKSVQEHSAEEILPTIKVPTLIVAAEDDRFTPLWISRKMHRLIPKADLFIIAKGTHAAIIEQPDLMNLAVEKFLNEKVFRK